MSTIVTIRHSDKDFSGVIGCRRMVMFLYADFAASRFPSSLEVAHGKTFDGPAGDLKK